MHMKSENMANISTANIPVYSTAALFCSVTDGNSSYQVVITLLAPFHSKYFTQCQNGEPVSDHSAPYSLTKEGGTRVTRVDVYLEGTWFRSQLGHQLS
jgi:hypothetical protein